MFSICDTDPRYWCGIPLDFFAQPLWGLWEQKGSGVNLKLLLPVVPHIITASVSVLGVSRLTPASMKLAR